MSDARPASRICFVSTGLARGGAETQLFRAASGLRSRGFDVHVVSILSTDYFGARLVEAGIPVTSLDASRTTGAPRILSRFLCHMRELSPAALAGFDYPGTMLARVGGGLARVPVVVSSLRSERIGSVFRRLALTWTDRLATVTTTNSHAVARKLVHEGAASRERVRVIPNGIDLDAIGPHLRKRRSELRRVCGAEEQDFLWLAAGRLEPPKDYPNLLAAMAVVARTSGPVRLAIAGQGPLREELGRLVSALGLDRNVVFLGARDDVPACMAAADATVLASAWEGLPNVVIEALAVATPTVCTDVGGAREIVQDGTSGLIVPSQNADALAAAMSDMMSRPESQRREMGVAGRRHVEEHFSLNEIQARWSGLFTELLSVRTR